MNIKGLVLFLYLPGTSEEDGYRSIKQWQVSLAPA